MIRYQFFQVSGSAGEQVLSDALQGTGKNKKKVRAIWFSQAASATPYKDTQFRAYLNRKWFLDFPDNHFLNADTTALDYLPIPRRIPVEVDLDESDLLQVGAYHGTASFTVNVTVEYEIIGTEK